jgi:hypothetical protein
MAGATYLCGGDETPGARGTDCPSVLHDHPLPDGYIDASEVASSRLYWRWANTRCGACGLYGWAPPQPRG